MMDNSFLETVTGESTNLELHTDLCARRYAQIIDRLDHMDVHMDEMSRMIRDIHTALTTLQTRTLRTYLTWAGIVIGVLISFAAGLATHILTS
jgi:hypothetical protein